MSILSPLRFILFLVAFILVSAGCVENPSVETFRFEGRTMATSWSVVVVADSSLDAGSLQVDLQQRLDRINRLMSTFDPDSELSRFNHYQGTDWFQISQETAEVIALSLEISRLTGGAFDISVGPLVELWGFGADKRHRAVPDQVQIESRLAWIGYDKLELRQEPPAIRKSVAQLRIDLSAIAKGYAVDQLAALIRQRGVDNYLVEVGGELQLAGHRQDGEPWRIAVEKPLEDRREVEKVLALTGTALATSGNYRNFYVEKGQRYAHTIDPRLGRPIRHRLASATVLDPSCARADALATALMVLGEERGRALVEGNRIAAYFLIHDKELLVDYASPEFKALVGKEQL